MDGTGREGGGPPFRKIGRHAYYQKGDVISYMRKSPLMSSTSAAEAPVDDGGRVHSAKSAGA